MLSRTKISNGNSTVVPSEVRHRLDISPGDLLIWEIKQNKILLEHRKKVTLDDVTGIVSKGGDAVDAKRNIQSGK
jgi:bifunctional DNA-binding transcriptional regulator/antitoxin component of YhaV-PrlF toxin-antitoxin module